MVQWLGGRGNAFGDGASKYLLPAKCKFGGDVDTPAGDADDGDRGDIRFSTGDFLNKLDTNTFLILVKLQFILRIERTQLRTYLLFFMFSWLM